MVFSKVTIGLDVGDRYSQVFASNQALIADIPSSSRTNSSSSISSNFVQFSPSPLFTDHHPVSLYSRPLLRGTMHGAACRHHSGHGNQGVNHGVDLLKGKFNDRGSSGVFAEWSAAFQQVLSDLQ